MEDTTDLIRSAQRRTGGRRTAVLRGAAHIVRGEGVYCSMPTDADTSTCTTTCPASGTQSACGRGDAPPAGDTDVRSTGPARVSSPSPKGSLRSGPQIEHHPHLQVYEANEVGTADRPLRNGKRGIVCTNATYHGNSELVGSLTRLGQQPPRTSAVRAFPFPESTAVAPNLSESALCDAYLGNSATRSRASRPPGRGSRR